MRYFGGWDKLQLLFPTALPQPGIQPSFQPSNSHQPSLSAWQYHLLLLSYPYYCSGQQKLINWTWCSSVNSCAPFSSLAVGTRIVLQSQHFWDSVSQMWTAKQKPAVPSTVGGWRWLNAEDQDHFPSSKLLKCSHVFSSLLSTVLGNKVS